MIKDMNHPMMIRLRVVSKRMVRKNKNSLRRVKIKINQIRVNKTKKIVMKILMPKVMSLTKIKSTTTKRSIENPNIFLRG